MIFQLLTVWVQKHKAIYWAQIILNKEMLCRYFVFSKVEQVFMKTFPGVKPEEGHVML